MDDAGGSVADGILADDLGVSTDATLDSLNDPSWRYTAMRVATKDGVVFGTEIDNFHSVQGAYSLSEEWFVFFGFGECLAKGLHNWIC